jgi:putative spermidine/putrescine transport system permease protein
MTGEAVPQDRGAVLGAAPEPGVPLEADAPLEAHAPVLTPEGSASPRRTRMSRRGLVTWAAVVPFFAYAAFFLLVPVIVLVFKTFTSASGGFTTENVRALASGQYRVAFVASIEVSVVSAIGGGLFGLFVAYAAVHGRGPRWIQPLLTTFSGVASNFAGIPLAFAFIATLGPTGVVTVLLADLGLHIYPHFTIFSLIGLSIVYVYFQLPLMILIIAPSLEGLRVEWREAADNLGATQSQYWWHVGLPVLLPGLAGAMVLLFGNAFSAYATPYALASGGITLVPILIGAVLSGNVVITNPRLGDSLAFGMIVIVGVTILAYVLLQRRASKWLR